MDLVDPGGGRGGKRSRWRDDNGRRREKEECKRWTKRGEIYITLATLITNCTGAYTGFLEGGLTV